MAIKIFQYPIKGIYKNLHCYKKTFWEEQMMKKIAILAAVWCVFAANATIARDIKYGYNTMGEYVPVEIGNRKIRYGYNNKGDYAPTAIGDADIRYGYNNNGDYAPTAIGGENIRYGYNNNGDYVPTAIGDRRIQYNYDINGNYVPTQVEDDPWPSLPSLW